MVSFTSLSLSFESLYDAITFTVGLLHSETTGSRDVDSSPVNIAANCVLLRHISPRHPLSTCSVAENKRYLVFFEKQALYFLRRNGRH